MQSRDGGARKRMDRLKPTDVPVQRVRCARLGQKRSAVSSLGDGKAPRNSDELLLQHVRDPSAVRDPSVRPQLQEIARVVVAREDGELVRPLWIPPFAQDADPER